jgi:hypothetical protein
MGSLAEFQQPLTDQYVSKYTPDRKGLSTPSRSQPAISGGVTANLRERALLYIGPGANSGVFVIECERDFRGIPETGMVWSATAEVAANRKDTTFRLKVSRNRSTIGQDRKFRFSRITSFITEYRHLTKEVLNV